MIPSRRLLYLALFALLSCQPRDRGADQGADTQEDADTAWTVSIRGYGPILAGMTLEEATTAGRRAFGKPSMGSDECDYVQFAGDSTADGVHFMVVHGTIARVDIQDSTIATSHGARIGDSEDRVQALYPDRVTIEPHKYTDGHYLIVAPRGKTDSGFAVIFETDGERVTTYRAGRLPEVRYIEGCS